MAEDEALTEPEREFIAMLAFWRREELYDGAKGRPKGAPWDDEHDIEVHAQTIERCGDIIRKMGGSTILGVRE